MAKIILSLNGKPLGEFPLDKERITIGRRPTHDIHIDNLAVSGDHAAIVSIYNYHFLEDLGSTNGTQINGKDIKKQVLNHNDIIQIGKHQLRYVNEEALAGAELEKTVAIRPQAARPAAADTPAAAPAAPAPNGVPEGAAYLEVVGGPTAGKRLALTMTTTTIGRQGAPLAVITRQPEGYYVGRGEGSRRPVVNGQAVDNRLLLQDGDVLELDGIRMAFHQGA